ncbi:hypothetical protein BDQ12DRAFT_606466 [Crucibulum laeve]|uniref:Uncharacterized protein n=1 Tax=Crucibulum laeve TaxID=68775 RepID=A0A5C3LYA5_9AGAR|nr:hypothetical protein BDQ12DRAFT_606466 [Crucibulum laeve]
MATRPTFLSRWISVEEPGGDRYRPGGPVASTTRLSRLSPLFTAILIGGLAMTIYGIYDIYGTMTMWPKAVRSDLRDGLTAKYKNDPDRSALYLQRAWDTARGLHVDVFKPHPYLKLSGIGIALAGVFESSGKLEQAYNVYCEVISQMKEDASKGQLAPLEHMRVVAVAYKLGEMAQILKKPLDEEESWLVYAVEEELKNVFEKPIAVGEVLDVKGATIEDEAKVIVSELGLPLWATKHDLAAPFEALGSFYSRVGKLDYAMPLYLQAVSILIPPTPQKSSADDRCRGAQMMGNIAKLILRKDSSKETIAQAESWAKKGLEVADVSRKSLRKHEICDIAYAMMLYNLAMIREMAGDGEKARALLTESMNHSKEIGLREGVTHAEEALRALDSDNVKFNSVLPGAQITKAA